MTDLKFRLDEFSKFIDDIIKAFCSILLVTMVVSITLQVFSRYIVSKPLPWTEELSRFCMIWMVLLGASTLIRDWDNTTVSFLLNKIPENPRWFVRLLIRFSMLMLMLILLYESIKELPVISIREKSAAMRISMFIPKSSVIFGSLMIVLQLIWIIINDFLEKRGLDGHD